MKHTQLKKLFIIGAIFASVLGVISTPDTTYAAETKKSCEDAGGTWSVVNSGQGGMNQVGVCTPKSKTAIENMTPLNQLKSYAYFNALSTCGRSGLIDGTLYSNQWALKIPLENVATPKTWLGSSVVATGFLIDSNDGRQQCSTMIKPALSLWGYSAEEYEGFIDKIGYKLTTPQVCTSGQIQNSTTCKDGKTETWTGLNTDGEILQGFQKTIKNHNYKGATPTLEGNDGLLYYRAQLNIEMSSTCAATPYKKIADLSAEEKALYKNNDGLPVTTSGTGSSATSTSPNKDYLIVHLVDGDKWVAQDWVYKIKKANWQKGITLNEKPSGGVSVETCVRLAKNTYNYAQGIIKAATAMIDAGKNPADVYGAYITVPGAGDITKSAGEDDENKEGQPTCVIDGIGWIICPVINFTASLADGAFGFLSDSFLRTDPGVFSTDNPTYGAWSVMRSIANVAFVIVFLIIIFSQLSSLGVSNYGVKKMLPRLIIGAILVNLSYFISQLAVDLSNILGYSLKDVFDAIAANFQAEGAISISEELSGATGAGFSGVAGAILAASITGVAFYALLSTLVPVILAALVALVMILFILVARQALIILLVIVSPLAFVAFLLPNTEKLFTQWRKALTALLLVFPIISVVFGASALASVALSSAFSSGMDGDAGKWFGQIIAAAVTVLPLFVVPTLLKKSLDGIPALGQLANKFASRANGNVSKKFGESYKGSVVGRGRAYQKAGQERYRAQKFAERVSKGGAARFFASGVGIGGAARAGNESLVKSAVAADLHAQEEEVKSAKAAMEHANLSGKDRQDLAMNGSVTKNGQTYSGDIYQKAAIQEQLRTGSMADIHAITGQSHRGDPSTGVAAGSLSKFAASISQGVAANGVGSKDPALAGKNIDAISQGNFNYEKAVAGAITDGKYTSEAFAGMHDEARGKAIAVAQAAADNGDHSLMAALQSAARGIRDSSEINGRIAGNQTANSQIESLLGNTAPGSGLILPGGSGRIDH